MFDTFTPIPFDRLGGRYSYLRIEDVPDGFSPNCQNIRFRPGSVESRPGLTPVFTKTGHSFLGLAQFIDNQSNKFVLSLDELANLDQQNGSGVTSIATNVGIPGSYLKVSPLFNREYYALFQPGFLPGSQVQYWDELLTYPVSPSGPGGKNHNQSIGNVASGSPTINNVTQGQTWCIGDPIASADSAIPAGTTVTNVVAAGAFVTLTISQNATATFTGTTLCDVVPLPGDSANAGNIVQGLHGLSVGFVTKSGYISEAGAPVFWNAAGSKTVVITGIPTGPSYVVARQLYFTQAAGLDFFFISTFMINDNTTTSVELNFADTDLAAGAIVDNNFDNFRLPDQAAVDNYNQRLVVWGGLNTVKLINLDFDGGFDSSGRPLGWAKGTNFTGGASEGTVVFIGGGAWKMTGDGATAVRGEIWNSEAKELIQPKTAYSISVRVQKTSGLAAGTLQINLIGTGLALNGFQLTPGQVTTTYAEYHGVLCLATDITSIPIDLRLRVALTATATNGQSMYVDRIQIYPTAQQYDASTLRISDAFNAERFDGVNGFMSINKDDGQRIVACGKLRWYYYIFKERSMYVTFDDGVNPPALWSINPVDDAVGCAGPNALAVSESFMAIASREGAYVFFGGRPTKISQEIQSDWNRINWAVSEAIQVFTDTKNKVVHFIVPIDSATIPNAEFILDYTEGFGTEAEPGGRKWSLDFWPYNIRASAKIETTSRQFAIYYAGDNKTGIAKAWQESGTTDDVQVIDAFYETSFARASPTGQNLYGGLSYTLSGTGLLKQTLFGLGDFPKEILPNQMMPVSNPGSPVGTVQDVEQYANLESERARVRFEVNGIAADGVSGDTFQVKRVVIYAKPWAKQRVY